MAHNTIKTKAIIGATLLPLLAFALPASAATWQAPAANRDASSRTQAARAPWQAPTPDREAAVYLNGWSSSDNPHDCNKGCTNSNGG